MASTGRQEAGDDSGLDQKRQKLEPAEDEVEVQQAKEEEMNISGVIEDCQENIFNYLDFFDLINVGISSPFFRNVAKKTINRKFCRISDIEIVLTDTEDDYSVKGSKMFFNNIKKFAQFLRGFGDEISNLNIDYNRLNMKKVDCEFIDQCIGLYCGDELTKLRIYKSPNFLANVEKSFQNLRYLHIEYSNLDQQCQRLTTLFPEVHRLLLFCGGRNRIRSFTGNFPKLEHLEIHTYHPDDMKNIIRNNSQLENLKIETTSTTFETITDLVSECKLLMKFRIGLWNKILHEADESQVNRFIIAVPALIELDCGSFRFTKEEAANLMEQMKSLKRFRFAVDGRLSAREFVNQLSNGWQLKEHENKIKGVDYEIELIR